MHRLVDPTHSKASALYRRAATVKRSVRMLWDFHGKHERTCAVCGNTGFFAAFGSPVRFDALCVQCGSLERHRQHALLTQKKPEWIDNKVVLHFAPEQCFFQNYSTRCLKYIRADINAGVGEAQVDICNMPFSDETIDTVICHQVLEHVYDDVRALAEIFRVMKPNGVALISTPVVDAWGSTLRTPQEANAKMRDLYFGQSDHLRYYGNDIDSLIRAAGFVLSKDTAVEPDVSKFGLVRGGVIYIAKKPIS